MNTQTPDWPQIIKDIQESGTPYREICDELACGLGTIGDLARGATKDATYTLGAGLLEMHKRKMRQKRRAN